jgi:23S rRNA pseudouridine1911/1915/1917 synthase
MSEDPVEAVDVVVPSSLHGERVDRVVSLLLGISRAESRAAIARGDVSVDGAVVRRGAAPLSQGQRLILADQGPTDELRAEPDVEVSVVYEDADLVVVDKSAGVVVHPGAGQRDGTLAAGLLARYPELGDLVAPGLSDPGRPGIVHRLDKGTSGLLVVARSAPALASLRAQIADRTLRRVYLGLAQGAMPDDAGVIDAPIGRSARQPTLMAVRADGRPSLTRYRVLARGAGPVTTLLELELETGRTHQIRVHLAALGHPIVNDTRYGHQRDGRLRDGRLFLHATRLAFAHPTTGERLELRSDLPRELAGISPAG